MFSASLLTVIFSCQNILISRSNESLFFWKRTLTTHIRCELCLLLFSLHHQALDLYVKIHLPLEMIIWWVGGNENVWKRLNNVGRQARMMWVESSLSSDDAPVAQKHMRLRKFADLQTIKSWPGSLLYCNTSHSMYSFFSLSFTPLSYGRLTCACLLSFTGASHGLTIPKTCIQFNSLCCWNPRKNYLGVGWQPNRKETRQERRDDNRFHSQWHHPLNVHEKEMPGEKEQVSAQSHELSSLFGTKSVWVCSCERERESEWLGNDKSKCTSLLPVNNCCRLLDDRITSK